MLTEIKKGNFLKKYIQEFIRFKKNLPTLANIALNVKCMQRCKTCRYWKIYENKKDYGMKKEEIYRIVDDLISFGVKKFRFVDTEPLLRNDLPEIIKYIKEKNGEVHVITTGMNLNEEMAKKLISSEVDLIRFSIDGYGELNDFIRGVKGAYEKGIRGIKILKSLRGNSKKPEIHVLTCVSKFNIREIKKIKEKIKEDTQDVDAHHFGKILEIEKETFEKTKWKGKKVGAMNIVKEGKSVKLNYEETKKLLEFDKNILSKILKIVDGMFYTRRRKCPSFHQVNIDVDGNLIPCSFLPGIKLGNLKEKSIKELWRKNKHLEFLNHLRKKGIPLCFEICWKENIFNISSKTASLREIIFKRIGKF